jgi:hypothetical protein
VADVIAGGLTGGLLVSTVVASSDVAMHSDMGMMLVWSTVYVLAAWSLLLDNPNPRRRT